MAGSTRRTMLAGMVATLALAGRVPLGAAGRDLRLPEARMRLERVLVRELGDGATITVQRGWDVSFARQSRGVVIAGQQAMVSVDAPASLSRLARIEEQRDTQAMFPIMLSESGLILAAGGQADGPADMAAALRVAEQMIAARPQSAEQRENLRRYMGQIHQAGSGQFESLPTDLFFPAGTPLRRAETVALPGGLSGEFELTWDARAAPGAAWLAEGERAIRTRIKGLERRSLESWRLRPI